jgi:TetR/AcrR family transcriptional repressor of bet genes
MERVAVAAKVSPGTVTFHFASKEALLLAALDHLAVEFDSARRGALVAVGDDPVRALLALIEVNFDPVISDRRKIAVWYAFWGEARARQEYMRRCGELDRQHSDQQVELFRRVITTGGHVHLDAEAVAFGLVGLMEGLWEDLLVEGRRFDRGRAKWLCRTYLTGLFPEELRRANVGGAEGGRT